MFSYWFQEMGTPVKFGFIAGYIVYDMSHYFFHHSSPKKGYYKNLKSYHMQHHYRNWQAGFGVSSKFWDIVFGTEIKM
jgi:4-hydroxysphinganine ceramide fatty acyl 2-hydroxylase